MKDSTLREWLRAEPFGLTLSSGFFGFFAHCGLLSVLDDERLPPSRISGSSAGALIGALWAAGLQTGAIRDVLFSLNRRDFWDPGPGLGLLRGRKFRALLEQSLPVADFAQCRVPLALSAHELWRSRTRVLDHGPLVPAIYASCAVPLLFHPIRHQGRHLVDGGVSDRPGLLGMPAGLRVLYHHLASRSPWRGRRGAHTRIPQRTGMQTVIIETLPRVGPNRLQQGPHAYTAARDAFQRALDQRVEHPVLRIQ